jgi:branched-chain amino acid transport system ATP-binding protein
MDLMMSVCDTIFVLDFGKLISTGTPEQVQADPAVTAAYLGTDEGARSEAGADTLAWREDREPDRHRVEGAGAAQAEEAGRD